MLQINNHMLDEKPFNFEKPTNFYTSKLQGYGCGQKRAIYGHLTIFFFCFKNCSLLDNFEGVSEKKPFFHSDRE